MIQSFGFAFFYILSFGDQYGIIHYDIGKCFLGGSGINLRTISVKAAQYFKKNSFQDRDFERIISHSNAAADPMLP